MLKSNFLLSAIAVSVFVFAVSVTAADFDITIISGGENPTVTIQNNTDFPAYLYDLVKADGTNVNVHTQVIDSATVQLSGDPAGVVEVRCVAAENAFEGWENFLSNPDSADGFFHYGAAVF